MNLLKRLFAPPVLSDEVQTEKAYLLYVIVWTLVCVPVPYLFFVFLTNSNAIQRALIQTAFGETVNFLLLWMIRRGQLRSASIIQVTTFWFFFTIVAFTEGGVQSPAYLLGYTTVISIAGILLGFRVALIVTLLSIITGGIMALDPANALYATVETNPIAIWIVSVVLLPIGAVLQYLSGRSTKRALEQAHRSEEKYKTITNVSNDYIFETHIDENGNTKPIWVGGAFEKLTGYTFDEYLKHGGWLAHLHPDDIEKDNEAMDTLRKGQSLRSEVRVFTRNKEVRWERISAHPIWNEKENKLAGIIGAVRDITEQKFTENAVKYERDLLQYFIDNIPDAVYFKDTDSYFIRINQAQARFLGLSQTEDAIGKRDSDFQDPLLAERFWQEEQHIIKTGNPIINRIELNPDKDGKIRWLSATKVAARDSTGTVLGVIGITRDITEQKLAENAHQDSLIQQAAILNNIPEMAWLKDAEGRYIAVNDAYAMTAGMDKDAIIGKTDHDLWPAHLADNYRNHDQEVMRTRKPIRLEELQADSHGREFWIETFKIAIFNDKNEVMGTTGVSRDISVRKESELAEQRRRVMLEKVIELGKYVTEPSDLKTTTQKIWHGIREHIGIERISIFLYNAERNSMDDTVGTDKNGNMVELWDIWVPAGEIFAQVLAKPDGLYFTHNYSSENKIPEDNEMHGIKDYAAVAAWAGNTPMAVICADNAITNKPITSEQLEALRLFAGYAGLAIENARLNETVQSELAHRKIFIRELEAKNAELERFTYTVSHDLKSPLVTIKGFLGYIGKSAVQGNFEQLESDLIRIDHAVDKMQRLLKDLLELSRIGRLVNDPEIFTFQLVAKDALEMVYGRLKERHVETKISGEDQVIYGDRVRVLEVLQNLIENAVKFTDNNFQPSVEIGTMPHDQYNRVFFVKDNGVGIDKQFHERVFGLFNKLDNHSEGTGIGLALVKRIIEVHGGDIWIESQPGQGTTFFFTLPAPPN